MFFAVEDGASRPFVARSVAELRRAGVAAETEHAGRSLKGQLTQAGRLGAAKTVVVGPETATLRVSGSRRTRPLSLDEPRREADGMTWRDMRCGEPRSEHVGQTLSSPGGSRAGATTAG